MSDDRPRRWVDIYSRKGLAMTLPDWNALATPDPVVLAAEYTARAAAESARAAERSLLEARSRAALYAKRAAFIALGRRMGLDVRPLLKD